MKTSSSLHRTSRGFALCVLVVLLAGLARQGAAQSFAVGLGGSLVSDSGTAADVHGFGTYGAHLFGEIELEKGTTLQVRVQRFGLPGTAVDAPNLQVDAGTISVSYLFREEWFQAGFFAGGGLYRLEPKDLEPGQVPADRKETAFGWHGGIRTVFALTPKFDARLEASGHLIRTDVGHKTIMVGGSIAYHF